jgi:hypothetical protein
MRVNISRDEKGSATTLAMRTSKCQQFQFVLFIWFSAVMRAFRIAQSEETTFRISLHLDTLYWTFVGYRRQYLRFMVAKVHPMLF